MVYYRKYRPQTIEELDNTSVRQKLTAVLSSANQPHAYLFTGPKGLGKTSSARIVAKVLNCESRSLEMGGRSSKEKSQTPTIEPCNKCAACIAITNGSFIDVVEIDGASNRGIDEIRDLKESTKLATASGKTKVYIIDEVHMLTTEAFNALLKTLEEPPSHVVFILCTTEVQKIPETVFSRCFQVSFTKATEEELQRSFSRIVKGEKIDIDDQALKMIALFSDGGFRDGAKLLEELFVLSRGKKITKQMVEEKLGLGSFDSLIEELLTAFANKDIQKGLGVTKAVREQGTDVRFFMNQLLRRVHDGLLEAVQGGRSLDIGVSKNLLELLSKAMSEMKSAVIEVLPLELAIIDWSIKDRRQETENREQEQKLVPSPNSEIPTPMSTQEVTVKSLKKQIGEMEKQKALGKGEEKVEKGEEVVQVDKMHIDHAPGNDGVSTEWMKTFWRSLITEVHKKNGKLAGVLRGCALRDFGEGKMTIETSFTFHKEQLDQAAMQELLVETAKTLIGKPVTILVILKSKS